jgi:hypothetical protein
LGFLQKNHFTRGILGEWGFVEFAASDQRILHPNLPDFDNIGDGIQ